VGQQHCPVGQQHLVDLEHAEAAAVVAPERLQAVGVRAPVDRAEGVDDEAVGVVAAGGGVGRMAGALA
jgi:hypothetical protein